MEDINIYKFTDTTRTIESLKDSTIYQALESAKKGDLSILKSMFVPFYTNLSNLLDYGTYKLMGWAFNCKDYCKKYLVRFRYTEYYVIKYAPNKTCLYNYYGRYNIIDCIEKNK